MAEGSGGLSTAVSVAAVAPTRASRAVLRPLARGQVTIDDGFWAGRQRLNRDVTIPWGAEQLERTGRLANLRRAAGLEEGGYQGREFNDSDVYKWLEAVGWELARGRDGELERLADEAIGVVEAAQQADGYLNSYCQLTDPSWRFTDLEHGHELYCAGHLFQAAVAHARATGGERLLGVAGRFADLLVEVFGEGGREGLCGHAEIEMALVELYRVTGDESYLALATAFVDRRGRGLLEVRRYDRRYSQDDVPVREARTIRGHAVRALYLACGVVDVYLETGDESLLDAAVAQWEDLVAGKTYLTGGVGSRHDHESFGEAYELPPDQAYCETCAAIASVMLNWRLLLATGEARHADMIERTLFNGVLAGLSLDGRQFFYVNPLQSRGGDARAPWFEVSCCPPNVMRTLASLEHYVATSDDAGVQLHQYASGTVRAPIGESVAAIDVHTRYPWDGRIELTIVESAARPWTLSLRIPSWCRAAELQVDGETAWPSSGEYAAVAREWKAGDRVTLDLTMPPRLTRAHHRVDAARGCVAIERGPLVYCIEEADLPAGVALEDVAVRPAATLTAAERPDLLGGVVVVEANGLTAEGVAPRGWPYVDDTQAEPPRTSELRLTAIPYFAWANRSEGSMRVWIPVAHDGERGGGADAST